MAEDLERADPETQPETAAEAQLAAVAAVDDESESEVCLFGLPTHTLEAIGAVRIPKLCIVKDVVRARCVSHVSCTSIDWTASAVVFRSALTVLVSPR